MGELEERQAACRKAAGYQKPTKRVLFAYIDELIKEGAPVDPKMIGMIWSYFEKQPSAKAVSSAAHWVAQAASSDETRPALYHVWAEAGKLVATDGHRVHLVIDQNVTSEGFLDAKTLEPVQPPDVAFPPYEQTIPAMPDDAELVKFTDFTPIDRESVELAGIRLDHRYVREAFAGSTVMRFTHNGVWGPFRLESPNGKKIAVVMPMRPLRSLW